MNLMVMSWGSLAGVFLAPYLYGLFWRRTTKAGAFAGMATGLGTAFTLFILWGKDGIPLAGAITMFVPLAVVPAVSLVSRPVPEQILQRAFGVERADAEKEETPSLQEVQ